MSTLLACRWKFAYHPNGERLRDIGLEANGSLINPRGYPEERVRAALLEAQTRRAQKRAAAAAKAVATKARRRALKMEHIMRVAIGGQSIGPQERCALCSRHLTDSTSIQRGIGSECWGGVLRTIERQRS